jgi:hypothetical protein
MYVENALGWVGIQNVAEHGIWGCRAVLEEVAISMNNYACPFVKS